MAASYWAFKFEARFEALDLMLGDQGRPQKWQAIAFGLEASQAWQHRKRPCLSAYEMSWLDLAHPFTP